MFTEIVAFRDNWALWLESEMELDFSLDFVPKC